MNERTKTGLEIIEAAILLGILGDAFLRATPWGLNVFLFVASLVAAMIMLYRRRRREFWNVQTVSLHGALIFFAAMYVWRDAIELKVLNALAILTILAVLTLPAIKLKSQAAGLIHYVFAACYSAANAAFAPFYLIFGDVHWKTIPQAGWTKHLIAVLRGLVIAAPILLVFGALFTAADAVFQGIIEKTLHIDSDVLFSHFLLIGFLSWLSAGYLRGAIIGFYAEDKNKKETANETSEIKTQIASVTDIKNDEKTEIKTPVSSVTEESKTETPAAPTDREKDKKEKPDWSWENPNNSMLPPAFTLGAIETAIILGLTNLLFLGFVVVQIPYLFGGMDLVQSTPDFKLAEYARRGFGELVAVAALVLPMLLAAHWLLRKDNALNEKIYRVLAGIQVVLLFVIMISATQRLLLYTGNLGYGLTSARLYPMVFMIWLALVFVWFALTVLRGAREQFAWGALWLALFTLGTLHVFNPDEFIVRTNVRLMQQGRSFDSQYISNLSDDAVPALLEAMPVMRFEQKCTVKWKLGRRFNEAQNENDFRTWNVSRWRARREMSQYAEGFETAECPVWTRQTYSNDF